MTDKKDKEQSNMRKLTKDELSAIQDLEDSQLIEQWSIDGHSNALRRVTVISKVNADWYEIDVLLNAIFPELEYRGKAGISVKDGVIYECFSIDVDGETLINLVIKKAIGQKEEALLQTDAPTDKENTQGYSTILDDTLELRGPCESFV